MSFRPTAEEYMIKARELFSEDPWESILLGLVHTQSTRAVADRMTVNRIKCLIPKPSSYTMSREKLADSLRGLPTYGTKLLVDSLEKLVNNYESVRQADQTCDRKEMNQLKSDKKIIGLGAKGIDMTLLDRGCEVPVVDIHLARHLWKNSSSAKKIIGSHDPDASMRSKAKSEPKGKRLKKFEEAGKGKEENPFSKSVHSIQNKGGKNYNDLWDIANTIARKEGYQGKEGVWHVATWLDVQTQRMFPAMPADVRAESSRYYVKNLFERGKSSC